MPKAATKSTRVAPKQSVARRTSSPGKLSIAKVSKLPDRRALHSYASWLFMERRLLCMELWPHVGCKAEDYDWADNAGYHWHLQGPGSWKDKPQPLTRAIEILDAVGVKWRAPKDRYDCGLDHTDNGARPGYPPQWPRVDGALQHASVSIATWALALKGLVNSNKTDHPDFEKIADEFAKHLDVLTTVKARSSEGISAKASAIRNLDDPSEIAALAKSLASDILERPEVMCAQEAAA